MASDRIVIRGAREHNLKNVDIEIPRDRMVVITGLSGSGKSSLAFDTIYAEGQRRYVESLSAYARQFLEQLEKPDVDSIEGLSPGDLDRAEDDVEEPALDRRHRHRDLRLPARSSTRASGRPTARSCGQADRRSEGPADGRPRPDAPTGTRVVVLAPVVRGRKGEYRKLLVELRRQGFGARPGERDRAGPRRGHRAGPEAEARRSTSWSTAWSSGNRRGAPRRLARDGAPARRGRGRRRAAGQRGRRGCSRSASPASRAASRSRGLPPDVLLQQPVRRVPRLRGAGDAARAGPRPRRARSPEVLGEGALAPWAGRESVYFRQTLAVLARKRRFSLDTPWKELSKATRELILRGSGEDGGWDGVLGGLERRYKETSSEETRLEIERYMSERPCPACGGGRLRPESLAVRVGGRSIQEVCAFTIREAGGFFDALVARASASRRSPAACSRRSRERLGFLSNVGLELPHARPRGRHALRRRGPAHPPRDADRVEPGGRPLHPRRAVDRAPRAGQRAAARHAAPRSATSATPCSWSSTTRRPSGPPTT